MTVWIDEAEIHQRATLAVDTVENEQGIVIALGDNRRLAMAYGAGA